MIAKRYEQFSHTADIGVRVFGRDLKELFNNAAFSLFDTIADLEGITNSVQQEIELTADNHEELLVLWLDELLYGFYTRSIIFSKFDIDLLTDTEIRAVAYGRPISANRNRLKVEIKAITYSGLHIKRTDHGYMVEIIFDV